MERMKDMSCPFCNVAPGDIVLEDPLCYARWDKHPVTEGHILVIPKRHFASYFDATPEERQSLWNMVEKARKHVDSLHHPDGYNIGINVGETAGQTILHLHIHLIPRRKGDMENPRGGVRHVIPGKGNY
jgi:diadenosine tetraphosphate (Ap4A) HIT family hydrolase